MTSSPPRGGALRRRCRRLSRRSTCSASSRAGRSLHVRLNRPAKRNAINDALVAQLHTAFVNLPDDVRAVVISGEGEHFCAGLDLSELRERSVAEGIVHSRSLACGVRRRSSSAACRWSRCCTARWSAAASSWRAPRTSASPSASTFYGLPEGQRGLFVGGGGSARDSAPDRRRAHDRHDAHRPGLRRRRRPARSASRSIVVDGRQGPGQGARAGRAASPPMRRCRTSRSCRRCRASPTWRQERRPVRRVADGRDRAGRRRRQAADARLPRGQGAQKVQKT